MIKKLCIVSVTLSLLAVYIPSAFSQPSGVVIGGDFITVKPEMHVRQRQALMVSAAKFLFPLVPMALGKSAYDPVVVARNALYLDSLNKMPWDNFVESTVGVQNTNALPEIYKDRAKFNAAIENYKIAVDRLVVVSKSKDEASGKAAISEVSKACGSCHGTFRARGKL